MKRGVTYSALWLAGRGGIWFRYLLAPVIMNGISSCVIVQIRPAYLHEPLPLSSPMSSFNLRVTLRPTLPFRNIVNHPYIQHSPTIWLSQVLKVCWYLISTQNYKLISRYPSIDLALFKHRYIDIRISSNTEISTGRNLNVLQYPDSWNPHIPISLDIQMMASHHDLGRLPSKMTI
jgi:hypothetical protein